MSTFNAPLSLAHQSWRWKILIATYVGYIGYYLTRNVFTIVKDDLAEAVGLSNAGHLSPITAAFYLSYMVGLFLTSAVGRRTGSRVLLLTGLGLSIVVNVLMASSSSYRSLMILMIVNGLVQATGWAGCVGAVAEWLRATERGLILGIWSSCLVIGDISVKIIGGKILEITKDLEPAFPGIQPWRCAFFGCTLLAIGVWGVLLRFQRNRPEEVGLDPIVSERTSERRPIAVSNGHRVTFKEYLRLVAHPLVIMMGVAYFSIKFIRYSVGSWLPTGLRHMGLETHVASYLSSITDVCGLPGMMLAGWALHRFWGGNWAFPCLFSGVGLVVAYLLVRAAGTNAYGVAVCFGLVGFMVHVSDSLLKGVATIQVAGERNGLAVAGLVNGFASLSPVLQELVIGHWFKSGDASAMTRMNSLTLVIAGVYVGSMMIILWFLRKRAAEHPSAEEYDRSDELPATSPSSSMAAAHTKSSARAELPA